MPAARSLPLVLIAALAAAVPACTRKNCGPPEVLNGVRLVDVCADPSDRPMPDRGTRLREVAADFRRQARSQHPPGASPYQMLALSGGGFYGSFGVGLLVGWTEGGTRPRFDVVTGISAGALMATFAFLGPDYDPTLRDEGVGVSAHHVFSRRSAFRIAFGDALFSTGPLRRKIRDVITPEVLAAVAREHAAGRRLYVGTTNLDTRRLVIWDMGAIAARGTPEALDLYHQVVLASSSIPGAFPPVLIKVEIDGKTHEELHVDGGASDQVMFRPFMVEHLNHVRGVPGTTAPPGSVLYVVNNGKLYADPRCVRPWIFPLIYASFRSIFLGKGRDEMYRIFLNCLECGVEFRMTTIPQGFHPEAQTWRVLGVARSDQERLFEIGRRAGNGTPSNGAWGDLPPCTDPTEQTMPRAGTRFVTDRGGPGGVGPCSPPAPSSTSDPTTPP